MANDPIDYETLSRLYDDVTRGGPIGQHVPPNVVLNWVRDADGVNHLYRPDGTWVGCMSDLALERLKDVLEGKAENG